MEVRFSITKLKNVNYLLIIPKAISMTEGKFFNTERIYIYIYCSKVIVIMIDSLLLQSDSGCSGLTEICQSVDISLQSYTFCGLLNETYSSS